jgi:hypothetical protein
MNTDSTDLRIREEMNVIYHKLHRATWPAVWSWRNARPLNPNNFDKQWKKWIFDRFKLVARDKEFLQKLFRNGVPQEGSGKSSPPLISIQQWVSRETRRSTNGCCRVVCHRLATRCGLTVATCSDRKERPRDNQSIRVGIKLHPFLPRLPPEPQCSRYGKFVLCGMFLVCCNILSGPVSRNSARAWSSALELFSRSATLASLMLSQPPP